MAGSLEGNFKELISPFLKEKLSYLAKRYGEDSREYQALAKQYISSSKETIINNDQNSRHYESEVHINFEGREVVGIERLYRRTVLLEPTTVCAAHCRWCLRGNYPIKHLKEDDLRHAARYIGSEQLRNDVREVLITGGDPLISKDLLFKTLTQISTHASNIKVIRIGTRIPFHQPSLIDNSLLDIFRSFPCFRFEIGIHANHPIDFWPESIVAIQKLQLLGMKFYNQHPLLKGVNDDFDTLVELYELLREYDIEAHYLFHAIPLRGMEHHRTTLKKGLDLVHKLSSCGEFSGRAKPKYAVLSDIGKIVVYEDTIIKKDTNKNMLLLRSGFNINKRLKWNPSWQIPKSVELKEDGSMLVWYVDGKDDLQYSPYEKAEKLKVQLYS